MEPIKALFDLEAWCSAANLPAELCELYGGDLCFPTTAQVYVIANFAATLDGVVSYKIPGQSGGREISGDNEADHLIMGLLRASADAVLVGAGTFNEVSPSHLWTAEDVWSKGRELYQRMRSGRASHPLNVIVSGSGKLDVNRAVFHTPGVKTLILTSAEGKERIEDACNRAGCSVVIRAVDQAMRIEPGAIIDLLHREFGVRLLLHEGGPSLFGQFVKRHLIDELFLTIAPQIAGRDTTRNRPALVQDAAFTPGNAPWLKLISAKRSLDHIFLRYRRGTETNG